MVTVFSQTLVVIKVKIKVLIYSPLTKGRRGREGINEGGRRRRKKGIGEGGEGKERINEGGRRRKGGGKGGEGREQINIGGRGRKKGGGKGGEGREEERKKRNWNDKKGRRKIE